MTGWKPITRDRPRVTREHIRSKGQKVKVTRPINAATDNAPYAGRGIGIFLKLACWLSNHVGCVSMNDRETADRSLRDKAAEYITQAFPTHDRFYPENLFIVTWNEVGYYDSQNDKVFAVLI